MVHRPLARRCRARVTGAALEAARGQEKVFLVDVTPLGV
jgi:hypothetical protein